MGKTRFITVGLGPVGRALTLALQDAGYRPAALIGRGRDRELAFARRIGAKLWRELPEQINNTDFIVVAIPTSKLASYADDLSTRAMPFRKLTFLHASGSLGATPFEPFAAKGAGVAAMHPYQTFPKRQSVVRLEGITWGITGNRKGIALARQLATDLRGKPLLLREEDRMLYHLSAILACTFVAANLNMAATVLESMGISQRRAVDAALPIAEETIRNVKELGIRAAMTGPQTRSDTALIRRHLKELQSRVPEIADVYDVVSRAIMRKTQSESRKKANSK